MKQGAERFLRILLGASVAGVGAFCGAFVYYATSEVVPASPPVLLSLKSGSSLRSAAREMERAGVLRQPELFIVMARLLGETGNIKAGSYEIDGPITPFGLLRKVTLGEVTQATVTFVEGWTFRQLRKALDDHPAVRHDTRELRDADILKRLAVDAGSPEGLFFPDTYLFARGSSDLRVLKRSYDAMQRHLAREWEDRDPAVPYQTPYEALVMASIIEKETGRAAERETIGGVLVNRLRGGMLLQVDPSVIYGLGDKFDGNLKKVHLLTDGPYNTYTRPGLPPTPIAAPGLASLRAALRPAKTGALYYVARGDGSSAFSRTLDEHNRAVRKYQLNGGRK